MSAAPGPCACGKVGWLSRRQAEDTLVRAKIAFSLYGNKRRREQRTYECPVRRGTWHLTSQPAHRPDRSIEPPAYALGDDETAREYISGVLFHDDAMAWKELLGPERVHQTLRVLGLMHQASLREGGRLRDDPEQQANYREWLRDPYQIRNVLVSRLQEARLASHRVTSAANIARSEGLLRQEHAYLKAMVRRLTLEIAEHRASHPGTPSPADQRLWAALDTLHMPRAEKTIGQIVSSGKWAWREDEHPLDGDLHGGGSSAPGGTVAR